MRILFVWTGVTSYMADCWRALQQRKGVELKVIVERVDSGREFAAQEVLHGLDFELIEKGRVSNLGFRADGWRPEVIFAGGWRSANTRHVITAFPDAPKVFCLDMPWRWSPRCIAARWVLRGFLSRFCRIYVPGEWSARYARWLGFVPDRIHRRLYTVRRVTVPVGATKREGFLYLGRFASEKRLDLLLAAYARYRALGGRWTLDLYGTGTLPALPEGAAAHPFAQPDEVADVYRSHGCLVMASAFDPWPLVILEAKTAGLEVIASDRCGNGAELGARVVPFGDVEAMAREMRAVELRGVRTSQPPVGYDCESWAARTHQIACDAQIAFCPGMDDASNGMAVVARLLANDECYRGLRIVHGAWLPAVWRACRGRFIRMPHGAFSPVYLRRQGRFKKALVRPIERYLLRKAEKVFVTCEAERDWVSRYEPKARVEQIDLKRYFNLQVPSACTGRHILYLGRRHPLKGVQYLERAVEGLPVELRIVSDATGEEKEHAWDWCDTLVLPTLSENFGLVIAEALERGKRVITTDGAPAWGEDGLDGRLVYLNGYCDGSDETRIALLRRALRHFA